MKKKLAALAALVAVVAGLTGCGGQVKPQPVAATSTTIAAATWQQVGEQGVQLLEDCTNDDDATMYACDHQKLAELTVAANKLPQDGAHSDITNVIGTFQDSYAKYWGGHQCGTPYETARAGACETMYRKFLESSLSPMLTGFENLAAGRTARG